MHAAIKRAPAARLLMVGSLGLMLGACGGGAMTGAVPTSKASSCTSGSCGTVLATLTDAPGDFLSYVVAIDALQLQKADGTVVQTIPAATTVDFAQLVNLTELVNAGQIPAGNYVSAVLTLDYSHAQITAQDATGAPVTLNPVDGKGNPLTSTIQVTVTFDSQHPLVITPSSTARIGFDFNLAASSVVNLTADTVTVNPTLVATVTPSDTKPIRVRGALVSASASQNDFVVDVEPFWSQADSGQTTVNVTSATTYQVNGAAYVGAAGLAALAALPGSTMIASFGTLDTSTSPATFTATNVIAGTSLQSPTDDGISGTVVAVTPPAAGSTAGTVLTVSRGTWTEPEGLFGGFMPANVMVTVGPGTVVTEDGSAASFLVSDISVGQHVQVFGTGTKSGDRLTSVDATAGHVRMEFTPAWGTITSMTAPAATGGGGLVLNLQSLDGLSVVGPASPFNFAGTGTAPANDANPASYGVDTGALSQAGLAVSAPVKVIGFVVPFGSVASPTAADFTAATLVNYAGATEHLNVEWGDSATTALAGFTAASTSLALSLTNVGEEHSIRIGPQLLDLTTLASPPVIVPAAGTTDVFTIGHEDHYQAENFNTFAAFTTQLAGDLTGGVTVAKVSAEGTYDATTATFTATRIAVVLSQ